MRGNNTAEFRRQETGDRSRECGEVGNWGDGGFSGNFPITLNPYCLLDSAIDIHEGKQYSRI